MDTKRYARFDRPGHAVTGDRTTNSPGVGYSYAHAIIDDHSRLAYVELHDDERAVTVTEFVVRALDEGLGSLVVAGDEPFDGGDSRPLLVYGHDAWTHRRSPMMN